MRRTVLVGVLLGACTFPASAQAFTWRDIIHRSTLETRGCENPTFNGLGKHCMSRRWPINYDIHTANGMPAARLRLNATGQGAHIGIHIQCTAPVPTGSSGPGKLYTYDVYPLSSSRSIPLGRSWIPLLPHKFVNLQGGTVTPATCTVVVYMTDPDYGWVRATIQRSSQPGQH